MKTSSLASAILLTVFASSAVTAGPCGASYMKQVDSLSGLPPGLAAAIGVGRPGLDGIADHDASFNKTDVIQDNLPMRRFHLAAVSSECAVVAIEHGGRGYSIEVLLFLLEPPNRWRLERSTTAKDLPSNTVELTSLGAK